MEPSELGSRFKRSIEAQGGDPEEPAVPIAIDAFLAGLEEPAKGRHEDVLLFEVFREKHLDEPREHEDVVAVLDRRLFYGEGDSSMISVLIARWTFADDPILAEHECLIMGRGPGLSPAEGLVSTEDFVEELRASPALKRMTQLRPDLGRATRGVLVLDRHAHEDRPNGGWLASPDRRDSLGRALW